jgi:hypothetical protein
MALSITLNFDSDYDAAKASRALSRAADRPEGSYTAQLLAEVFERPTPLLLGSEVSRTSSRRSGLLMQPRSPRRRRRSSSRCPRPTPPRVPLAVHMASSSARLPSIRGDRGERSRTSCKHALDRGGEPLHLSNGSRHREPETFASGSPPVDARATARGESVSPVTLSAWRLPARRRSPHSATAR